MPVVHENIWKKISVEVVKQIIAGITQVFVDMGIPAQTVELIVMKSQRHIGVLKANPPQKRVPMQNLLN